MFSYMTEGVGKNRKNIQNETKERKSPPLVVIA